MANASGTRRQPRTLLEQLIKQRQQTFEEFAEYAETFARDHDEPGTLSVRHLQRLVAGHQPIDTLRPATARLLESIFDRRIGELLTTPTQESDTFDTSAPALNNAHLLRVAITVVVKDAEVLMVCRRKEEGISISWQFPAGMVKPGFSSETIAVRETLGETGVHCAVKRRLGARLHPITNVFCEYLLCDYLAGEAHNVDVSENVDVSWIDKTKLTRVVPAVQIFPPALEALDLLIG